MRSKIGFLFLILILSSCISSTYSRNSESTLVRSCDCTSIPITIKHKLPNGNSPWRRTVSLPEAGRFVEESHYVTTDDRFGKEQWPNQKDQGIGMHLRRSFKVYRKYDPSMQFENLYSHSWQKEWTPEEGGHFGQGAVGEIQLSELTAEMEMWFMTMMWAKGERPKRGTRFLLTANNKHVIVIAGYETGPSSKTYLGGVTREVHKWLNTTSESEITISLLKDQSINIGPVVCN